MRGEQREEHQKQQQRDGKQQSKRPDDIDPSWRRFQTFHEVEDMSIVANHCRRVGLENLFKTCMKVYDNTEDDDADGAKNGKEEDTNASLSYGALIHVDHMNDGKAYRKWLRKVCREMNVALIIRQCHHGHYSAGPDSDKIDWGMSTKHNKNKPIIIVVIAGYDHEVVADMLKRWRTSRVDVDSKGKPCLERMMNVLVEGEIITVRQHKIDGVVVEWDGCSSTENGRAKSAVDAKLHSTRQQLLGLVEDIGGSSWVEVLASVLR